MHFLHHTHTHANNSFNIYCIPSFIYFFFITTTHIDQHLKFRPYLPHYGSHCIVVVTIFNWTFNNHYYVCKPSKDSMFHIKTNILYHFKLHFNWWFVLPFFYISNFQLPFLVLWCTTNLLYYLVHWWTSITNLSTLFSCSIFIFCCVICKCWKSSNLDHLIFTISF